MSSSNQTEKSQLREDIAQELLHENGWNVMLQIAQISFLGYIALLLIIPIFSEFQDRRMDIVVRVSRNGLTMRNRAKQSLRS